MAASAPVLAATAGWQLMLSRRGGEPLIEPSLFRAPSFRSGLLANFAFMACFASYMFTVALLLQTGLRLDAFRAGLAFAPAGVGFAVSALLAPRLVISLGNGVVVPSLISGALHDVPPQHAGAAAGALSTAQQFAGAAGVAVIGTLYFTKAGAGQGAGMAWSAAADALLLLVVAGLVLAAARPKSIAITKGSTP